MPRVHRTQFWQGAPHHAEDPRDGACRRDAHRCPRYHDATLDRTTDCSGPVSSVTLAQLKQCDAGNGQQVPTLREVFERYGHRVNYSIETKSPEDADHMEEQLLGMRDECALRGRSLTTAGRFTSRLHHPR
jgi:hypothetical protein